jgi:predicted homoserine dehydrogenase-like protein
MGTWHRFRRWAQEGGEVAIAICGAGYLGRALVTQLTRAEGMRPALVVNRTAQRGIDAYAMAGVDPAKVLVSRDPDELSQAIAEARPAVTADAGVLPELADVQLVVEATGAMSYGAETILAVMDAGKDVVSMNAEVEAVVGPLLHHVARQRGVVYTPGDGDQPGAMLRLIELVESFGLEVGAAINCKGNLDLHQNPDDSRPYAERDNVSVQQTTSWGDGTKMQIENAVVANIAGLVPDIRGMHGIRTTVAHATRDIGAALSRPGCVDYTLGGDFGGGVGVLARDPLSSELVQASLRLNKMGEGPDYFFFRPFHIAALEVPLTVAEVVLDRTSVGAAPARHVVDVVAMAKCDLLPGQQLDAFGGFTCYGFLDDAKTAEDLLPIGLSQHARAIKPVAIDEPIPLDAVELDEDATMVRLWRRQQAELAPTQR